MSNVFRMRSSKKRVLAVAVATGIGLPAWGLGGVAVADPPADTTKPTVDNVAVTPSPTGGAGSVTLTADLHDTQPGKVASAYYSFNSGATLFPMDNDSPDGMWQNKDEEATATISTAGLSAGDHEICVFAVDDAGLMSVQDADDCVTLTVSAAPDTTAPKVTINQAVGQADPTGASPINFTVIFDENVTGFGDADVVLSGTAGATTAVVTGGGTTYNVAVSGMTSGGKVIANIPAGAAKDAANNDSAAATFTDNDVTFNMSGGGTDPLPTVDNVAVTPNPTLGAGSVTLTAEEHDTQPGTIASAYYTIDAGGTHFSMDNASNDGMWQNKDEKSTANVSTAGLSAGDHEICVFAVDDAAQTSVQDADDCVTLTVSAAPDVTAPTVTINQAAGQPDPTNASPINFTVIFDENVTDFGDDDIVLSGTAGATTAVVTGGGDTYNVAVSGMTGSGTVIANIAAGAAKDAANNLSEAATFTDNEVTYDAPDVTAPTVTIDQAADQADPTSDLPIRFSVVFSEDVTGFDVADLDITAPAGAVATVGDAGDADAKTYTVSIAGLTEDGDVTVGVKAGAAQDAAANASEASTSTDNTVTYDDLDELTVVASRHEVNQGESVTMTATMVDAGGHTVDVTDETVFTSDVASDVIVGDEVTFPHASPHTITGTYVAGDTDDDVVEVNPRDVGPVDRPNDGNNGSEGTPSNGGTGGGTGSEEDGEVAGEFLPGTGAGTNPIALGLAGLGILGAGVAVTRVTRRRSVRIF